MGVTIVWRGAVPPCRCISTGAAGTPDLWLGILTEQIFRGLDAGGGITALRQAFNENCHISLF